MTLNTRDLVHVALFAAVTAVLGLMPPVNIPALGLPITAQSMGVMLSGSILGARRGALALILFLMLVAAGFPLLAGGSGGIGVFFGPTAGFLIAWPASAFVVGWLSARFSERSSLIGLFAANVLGGIAVMYAVGVPWAAMVMGVDVGKVLMGSLLFLPGDFVKAGLTALAVVSLRRSLSLPA